MSIMHGGDSGDWPYPRDHPDPIGNDPGNASPEDNWPYPRDHPSPIDSDPEGGEPTQDWPYPR